MTPGKAASLHCSHPQKFICSSLFVPLSPFKCRYNITRKSKLPKEMVVRVILTELQVKSLKNGDFAVKSCTVQFLFTVSSHPDKLQQRKLARCDRNSLVDCCVQYCCMRMFVRGIVFIVGNSSFRPW
jgi:hypothetical protein